ncbi:MAG TPA: hypothetical protein PKN33_03000 [Phycisphaerae bacterium]|nr:hypothetical protein [Phycisphaerae bacterium]
MRNPPRRLPLTVAFLLIVGFGTPFLHEARAAGALDNPSRLTLKTSRVVIFKDGYGLFVKQANGVADRDGRVFTDEVPDGAILGSFWASAGDRTLGMHAEWVEEKSERKRMTTCISIIDMLRANQGKLVQLGLHNRSEPPIYGRLIEVLDLESKPVGPDLLLSNTYSHHASTLPVSNLQPGLTVRELIPTGGQFVLIETPEHQRLVMPVAEVRTVSGEDIVTQIERTDEVTTVGKRLTFDLGKQAAGQPVELNLFYFFEGVRWIPTYRLDCETATEANLDLQGELLNEAEDITDAAIDLVVGVPSFRFKSVVSPLSLERMLRQTLAAAAPNLMGQMRNDLFTQRSGELPRGVSTPPPVPGDNVLDIAPELAANAAQDLFVYSHQNVTLKKGARLTLPLWRSDIPLRDLYTMDIRVARDFESGQILNASATADGSPLRLSNNKVWHQFELINKSQVPWTTGPALLLRNFIPLAQELLTYTPVGSTTLIPVTVAVDVRGDYVEEELSRKPDAIVWNRKSYSLIKKRGTITLTNYRKENSQMRITTSIGGRATTASDNGDIHVNDHRRQDWNGHNHAVINNHSDVTWELTLKPGESKTVSYEFEFYVR